MSINNPYCQDFFKLVGIICQIQTTAQHDRIDILLVETRLLPCIRVQCCFPVLLMNVIGGIGKVLCQLIGSIVGGGSTAVVEMEVSKDEICNLICLYTQSVKGIRQVAVLIIQPQNGFHFFTELISTTVIHQIDSSRCFRFD